MHEFLAHCGGGDDLGDLGGNCHDKELVVIEVAELIKNTCLIFFVQKKEEYLSNLRTFSFGQ